MLEDLKIQVCRANLALVEKGLVIETWGNASAVDRARGVVVIKPSGVPYERMKPSHMVAVRLDTGKTLEGTLRPSSDTATHLELYRAFPAVGGICHTHSLHATAWAQACREIPALGTTHADYWHGSVPCTRAMTAGEIKDEYEANTGRVIIETVGKGDKQSAVLVANHGPFTWGATVQEAVERAVVLEFVACLAGQTLSLSPKKKPMPAPLLDKHFFRKHGPSAYYGQSSGRRGKHQPL